MKKKLLYLSFILVHILFISNVKAQKISLSESAAISVLTMGPGTNLNDSFGHSAFRITDPNQNIDVVYNYGVYNFDTPNFYLKFIKGQLMYQLDRTDFSLFYQHYSDQNRWIKEQVLDLTIKEKQEVFDFLQNNYLPENRNYIYDFFFENCATRIRDVLAGILKNKLVIDESFVSDIHTFRQLIQKNVHWNSWGSFGMDLAIGAVVDRNASSWEHQFLPEYIFKALEKGQIKRSLGAKKLVKKTSILNKNSAKEKLEIFLISPFFVVSLLALIILGVTYKDYRNNSRNRWMDSSLYALTGTIGIFLILLWFATDHFATQNNYNLLWAVPLSLFFVIEIAKKNPKYWLKKYIMFQILMLLLLSIHWITGVQSYPVILLPLLIAIGIRYIFIFNFLNKK
ncbi:MAG: DUF4105 domain-containing protein [Flavobacteriales bacterium]|nr:MAG: DUF4105 domain-containing protein [Flavobacteriales bacterium]